MRQHGSKDETTGKTITVVEDITLKKGYCKIECAKEDEEYALMIQAILKGELNVNVAVKNLYKEMRFLVPSSEYDLVVELVDDPTVEPISDDELASEIMRVTKQNN